MGEVGEDALGGLGAQVRLGAAVLGRAEVGLQHAGELLGLGELALHTAVGAVDVGEAVGGRAAVLGLVRLFQVVRAVTLVTGGALGQRVREGRDVAGGHPDLGGQDHGRVKADDVLTPGDHRLPPLALDVLLELDTERAVIPGGLGAAVDVTARENEATALAQADDGVDLVGGHGALFITRTNGECLRLPAPAPPFKSDPPLRARPHLSHQAF